MAKAGGGQTPGELMREARDRAQRNSNVRDAVYAAAENVADEVRIELAREAAIEAAIFVLSQLGHSDPGFLELAGFGRPLPDWADWYPEGDDEKAAFDRDVRERAREMARTKRRVADEQAAEEYMGERHYRPKVDE